MSLSLESIYKPVNDFFITKFKKEEGAPVEFRMQQYGSVIDENDFEDIDGPDEEFSELVNQIPVVHSNGIHLDFLQNNIDQSYEQMLHALPKTPVSYSTEEKESIEQRFMSLRATALREWEEATRARGNGVPGLYTCSSASPSRWYSEDSSAWEKRTFKIEEPSKKEDSQKKQTTDILRIRLSDAQLMNVLPILQKEKKVEPIELSKFIQLKTPITFFKQPKKATVKVTPRVKVGKVSAKNKSTPKKVVVRPLLQTANIYKIATPQLFVGKGKSKKQTTIKVRPKIQKAYVRKPKKTATAKQFSKAFHGLKLNQKILVKDYIKEKSPTKTVNTNGVSISFEYCMVQIQRPWFNEILCNVNRNWYLPGMHQGELNDPTKGGLDRLPIAFVAVKNLQIKASWNHTDKEALKKATSFGPFDINSHNIEENGSLSHDGIQIIGWVLQKLPILPPN